MSFVKNDSIKIGDKVTTTIEHTSLSGHMEIGTEVTVTGISYRGYDIMDNDGNRIIEIGWVI